jgi:arsenate reductase-like glutaredoxin family protein
MQVARQELDEMTHNIKVLITSICALSAIFEIDIDRTKIDKEVYNYILQSTDDLLIFINKEIQDFKQLNKEKKYYEGSAVLQNLASRPYKNFILKSYALKGCSDDNK